MIRVTSFGKHQNPQRDLYISRIKHSIPFEWNEISVRKMPATRPNKLLSEEKKFLDSARSLVLLDPKGKLMTSQQLADFCFAGPDRHFVVGPAFGFTQDFYEAASQQISLSPLDFTHSLAQTMLAESLYRSVCIHKNHPFVK